MRRLSRPQAKQKPPNQPESTTTRVAVAASKSTKRIGKAKSSRKSVSGAEASDAFSDALQRHESKRPTTASAAPSGTARRGSRIAVGPPSPPKADKEVKESEAKAASRRTSEEKNERAGDDSGDEENDSEKQEGEEDGDASGFYGEFVQTKRCETLCRELGMTTRDIRRLKRKYDANDMYNTYVTRLVWFVVAFCC